MDLIWDHTAFPMTDLSKVTPPKDLTEAERLAIFQHVFRRLAAHRNTAELYAIAEYTFSSKPQEQKGETRGSFVDDINQWGQDLLQHVWHSCQEPGGGKSAAPLGVSVSQPDTTIRACS